MNPPSQPHTCQSCGGVLQPEDQERCSECGVSSSGAMRRPRRLPRFLSLPPMRYPNSYVWLVFVSSLDIFLTMLVLYVWKGREANPIADAIIVHLGFRWTIVFKFALIVLVIVICEVVGRRSDRAGRKLAIAAIVITAIPVAYSFALMFSARAPENTHLALILSG